ncbi:MAG: S-layer homology domain-containing protein [Peptostreptococcaceae bacterium]
MKKQLSTAMAAAMAFGTVVPAFANDSLVTGLAELQSTTVLDARKASGYGEVDTETRINLYDFNGATAANTASHTLKKGYENVKVLDVEKHEDNAAFDKITFIDVAKNQSTTDATIMHNERARLAATEALIESHVQAGWTKQEQTRLMSRHTLPGFAWSEKIITLTKGTQQKVVTIQYSDFLGEMVLPEEDKLATLVDTLVEGLTSVNAYFNGQIVRVNNTIDQINGVTTSSSIRISFNDLVSDWSGAEGTHMRQLTSDEQRQVYYTLNALKYRFEQNSELIDFKIHENGKNSIVVEVFKVDSRGLINYNTPIITLTLDDLDDMVKSLVLDMPNLDDTDYGHMNWAKDFIFDAMLNGYIDNSETFRPQDEITRAEFAKIVCTVFGLDTSDESVKNMNVPFNDVVESNWHYKYIAALYNATNIPGTIINGYEDGSFKPSGQITRQEAAKMIAAIYDLQVKALNTTGVNAVPYAMDGVVEKIVVVNGQTIHVDTVTNFKDDKDIAVWADESISALAKEKVIEGYEDGTFKPQNTITRAEAIVMLLRADK